MRTLLVLAAAGMATAMFLFAPSAHSAPSSHHFKVQHSESQWKKLLGPEAFDVMRKSGTERAGTSNLLDEHRPGTFECKGCDQKLFSSRTKFESGTGWPSFWKPIKGSVIEVKDGSLGMERTEIICARCGSHLGHVFNDGPQPTGLRYCMNGVALKFVPATSK